MITVKIENFITEFHKFVLIHTNSYVLTKFVNEIRCVTEQNLVY